MNLDLCHRQIVEANLIELVQQAGDAISEIQVADAPGRCVPGPGRSTTPSSAESCARWVPRRGERATRIELASSVWKTEALPLSYARRAPAGDGCTSMLAH